MTRSKYRQKHLIMLLFLLGILMLTLIRHANGQSQLDSAELKSKQDMAGVKYEPSYFLNGGVGYGGSGAAIQLELDFQCSKKGMLTLGVDATAASTPFGIKAYSADAGSIYAAYGRVEKNRNV